MSEIKKVHRSEINKVSHYIVDCPYCGAFTELDDYRGSNKSGCCEICDKDFDIEKDEG